MTYFAPIIYSYYSHSFSLNSDKFTPLDMAILRGEADIVQLLLLHGATENPSCKILTWVVFPIDILLFTFNLRRAWLYYSPRYALSVKQLHGRGAPLKNHGTTIRHVFCTFEFGAFALMRQLYQWYYRIDWYRLLDGNRRMKFEVKDKPVCFWYLILLYDNSYIYFWVINDRWSKSKASKIY